MPTLTIEEVAKLQQDPNQIMNVALIGCFHSGKSTTAKLLFNKKGIFLQRGTVCDRKDAPELSSYDVIDTSFEESQRGMTLKSKIIPLAFGGNDLRLVTLMDTPGHFEFSGEVSAALRMCDGALVVIDYTEGVTPVLEKYVKLALSEKLSLAIFFNKVDVGLRDHDPETFYQACFRTVADLNEIIKVAEPEHPLLDPAIGNVVFGSALQGWAFSIPQFAEKYSKKFALSEAVLSKKLWGDMYFSKEDRKWRSGPSPGSTRGFTMLITEPLVRLSKACTSGDWKALNKILGIINILLKTFEKALQGEELLEVILSKWLSGADALGTLVEGHLPSAAAAAAKRAPCFYNSSDESLEAMMKSDPSGPLVIQITKQIQRPDDPKRFYPVGRIFSGTLRMGQQVRILGPLYTKGRREDLAVKAVQRVGVLIANKIELLPEVGPGNIVGIEGTEQYFSKTATFATSEDTLSMMPLKFLAQPLMKVSIAPLAPSNLPKFVEALRCLSKHDLQAISRAEENGYHYLYGTGELHLQVNLSELRLLFSSGEIEDGDLEVVYREIITTESTELVLAKSPNRHNRFWGRARPISNELLSYLESTDYDYGIERLFNGTYQWPISNQASYREAQKERRSILNTFEEIWNDKIWCFGPDNRGSNFLVDSTKGLCMYDINEVHDSAYSAFQWTSKEGPLCEENLRGVRVDLLDAALISSSIHRGGGSIIPAFRKLIYGSVLKANPRLLEPTILVDLVAPEASLDELSQAFSDRHGFILSQQPAHEPGIYRLAGSLPLIEEFGFQRIVTGITEGRGSCSFMFDSWKEVEGDPLEADSPAYDLVRRIRERKGLNPVIDVNQYIDRL